MDATAPTEAQLDALREVANVGCGHAASALSRLVGGRQVSIEVPRAFATTRSELAALLGGGSTRVVAASLQMRGELSGGLAMLLSEKDAQRLCELILPSARRGPITDEQRSAFAEAANIVASACLNAIGQLTGLTLLPTVPQLSEDVAAQVVEESLLREAPRSGVVVVLEARFSARSEPPIEGRLLVAPDRPSLERLLQRLGV